MGSKEEYVENNIQDFKEKGQELIYAYEMNSDECSFEYVAACLDSIIEYCKWFINGAPPLDCRNPRWGEIKLSESSQVSVRNSEIRRAQEPPVPIMFPLL